MPRKGRPLIGATPRHHALSRVDEATAAAYLAEARRRGCSVADLLTDLARSFPVPEPQ
jgi:hypothetical protein